MVVAPVDTTVPSKPMKKTMPDIASSNSTVAPNNFEVVNKIRNAAEAIQFLDGADSLEFIQDCKRKMRALCPALPGQHVLDVGCGVGQEVRTLATAVGAQGRVVGVDLGEAIIGEARQRFAASGLPVEFRVGNAGGLDFPDDSFDLSRAERVIEYVDDPRAMLAEMVRVVRPGGSVLLFDFDYRGSIVDASDRVLSARIDQMVIASVPNGEIGAQLPRLCRAVGLENIRVLPQVYSVPFFVYEAMTKSAMQDAVAAGTLSAEEFRRWWDELETAERNRQFFATFSGFVVTGRKPGAARR